MPKGGANVKKENGEVNEEQDINEGLPGGDQDDLLRLILESFFCPITKELMQDPVIAADGFTYERLAIDTWIKTQLRKGKVVLSPMTNEPLAHYDLKPNKTLKSAIGTYNEHKIGEVDIPLLDRIKKLERQLNQLLRLYKKNTVTSETTVSNIEPLIVSEDKRTSYFFLNTRSSLKLDEKKMQLQNQLVTACEKGSLSEIKELIAQGADPALPNHEGKFPLGSSIWSLNMKVVKFLCKKINPDSKYFGHCVAVNIEKYGARVPEWKLPDQLTLEDLNKLYLNNNGRDVVFSDWIWEKSGCDYGMWTAITADGKDTVAHTRHSGQWHFGPDSSTKLEQLVRLEGIKGVVWGALLKQCNIALRCKKAMEAHIDFCMRDFSQPTLEEDPQNFSSSSSVKMN